jgi:hypothetical protein
MDGAPVKHDENEVNHDQCREDQNGRAAKRGLNAIWAANVREMDKRGQAVLSLTEEVRSTDGQHSTLRVRLVHLPM